MEIIEIIAQESGERIDALLARSEATLTRSAAQKLLDAGKVSVNGKAVRKNYKCQSGDTVRFALPEPEETELVAQDIPLEVVFEDGDVIVINKPRGMVVHPAAGHPDGTLVNALMHYCGDTLSGIGGEKRPGIVHRIDKDTSGLLIVAKNDLAHLGLSEQLKDLLHQRTGFGLRIAEIAERSAQQTLQPVKLGLHFAETCAGNVPRGIRLHLPDDAADVLACGDLSGVCAAESRISAVSPV